MIWIAVAVCLLISFVFAGIEAGILSVNRVRLKHRLKQRDRAAVILTRLLRRPARLLVTVLLVTNLMNISALVLTTQELARQCGPWGYVVALLIALPVYLIGLEMLPKSLFRRFPYRALAALTGPLRLADFILSPLHFIGGALSRRLLQRRTADPQKLFAAREDFKYLTIESEKTGALSEDARKMIHHVIDFRGVKALDVMKPLAEVRTIPARAAVGELIAQSRATQFDRWPVVSEKGEIIGLVQMLDLALDAGQRGTVENFQRRIVEVGANEPAYNIVRKMRAARITLAVVRDAEGRQIGVVSWEDLIQRLVTTALA